jgi:hypothetical protein
MREHDLTKLLHDEVQTGDEVLVGELLAKSPKLQSVHHLTH